MLNAFLWVILIHIQQEVSGKNFIHTEQFTNIKSM